jgi:hypothetical protein
VVEPGEKPYKIVKASKMSSKMCSELYGEWQTEIGVYTWMRKHHSFPNIKGIVVCKEFEDTLTDAYNEAEKSTF